MKKWRFLGIDDSFDDRRCCIVGCVTCDGYVEGFMYEEIEVDGLNATEKVVKMVKKSKFRDQLRCIFLPGLTFGGFNVVDIQKVYDETATPVVVVMRRMPDMKEFMSAIENLSDADVRKSIVQRAGEIYRTKTLYIQFAGTSFEEAGNYLRAATIKGNMPESVRIAHLVASAIIHGESKGKA